MIVDNALPDEPDRAVWVSRGVARDLPPQKPKTAKVSDHLTPAYAAFMERSRFCLMSTVGPEGTDGSPCGDEGPVVTPLDGNAGLERP